MRARIDAEGYLFIQRGAAEKQAYCPSFPRESPVECGDWCSLFGEPFGDQELELCHRTIKGLVIDERPQPPPKPKRASRKPREAKLCQVCLIQLSGKHGAKAEHFRQCHPEYEFEQEDRIGYGMVSICGKCGVKLPTIPALVRHYEEVGHLAATV